MLSFTENKTKKRDEKSMRKKGTSLDDASAEPADRKRKPAWVDNNVAKLQVNINEKSRSRKLMKTEEEKEIAGSDYAKRLQDYYASVQNDSAIFGWAKRKESVDTTATSGAVSTGVAAKGAESGTNADDSDSDDPISKLLKSNTNVYERQD